VQYLAPVAALIALTFSASPIMAQSCQDAFVPGEDFMLQWVLNGDCMIIAAGFGNAQ
jgi:hypothetical protein